MFTFHLITILEVPTIKVNIRGVIFKLIIIFKKCLPRLFDSVSVFVTLCQRFMRGQIL